MIAIVKELESGAYPPCEWVAKAPDLVIGFFAYKPSFAPGHIDRMLDAYLAFARTHFRLDDVYPSQGGIGYAITSKMADLFALKGERVAGVERTLDTLAKETGNPGALYLKALFDAQTAQSDEAQRGLLMAKAADTLHALSESGAGLDSRRALATAACLAFERRASRSCASR